MEPIYGSLCCNRFFFKVEKFSQNRSSNKKEKKSFYFSFVDISVIKQKPKFKTKKWIIETLETQISFFTEMRKKISALHWVDNLKIIISRLKIDPEKKNVNPNDNRIIGNVCMCFIVYVSCWC